MNRKIIASVLMFAGVVLITLAEIIGHTLLYI